MTDVLDGLRPRDIEVAARRGPRAPRRRSPIPGQQTRSRWAHSHSSRAKPSSDGEWDGLSRAFERTILTSELLVAYGLGVAGKPSRQ